MGTPVAEQREFRVTVRFTETEKQQLIYQMENSGYLSMSRYLRIRCLDGKAEVTRECDAEGADLRTQINILSTEISKIGANYNKVVKEFRSLLGQKRRDGSPVVNTRAASYFLQQLNTRTLEVKALMEHMIGLYENSRHVKSD